MSRTSTHVVCPVLPERAIPNKFRKSFTQNGGWLLLRKVVCGCDYYTKHNWTKKHSLIITPNESHYDITFNTKFAL